MVHITVVHGSPRPYSLQYLLRVTAMCLEEARPSVLMVFLLRFLVGAAMYAALVPGQLGRIAAAALSWELAVFAAYLFNGIMDVREDRINGSRRPISRGDLSVEVAATVAAAAASAALILGIALGTGPAVAVAALLLLGWLYSAPPAYLKRRTFGTPATCVTYGLLTYYAGSVAVAGPPWQHSGLALHIFAGVMALWMGLVGVPAKDLPDAVGDAAAGRRTFAVRCRESTVRRTLALTACMLAVTFCAVTIISAVPLAWPNVVMIGGAVAVAVITLTGHPRAGRRQLRRPFRAFMVTQYLANLSVLIPALAPLLFAG